jgi:hypothetical protein
LIVSYPPLRFGLAGLEIAILSHLWVLLQDFRTYSVSALMRSATEHEREPVISCPPNAQADSFGDWNRKRDSDRRLANPVGFTAAQPAKRLAADLNLDDGLLSLVSQPVAQVSLG